MGDRDLKDMKASEILRSAYCNCVAECTPPSHTLNSAAGNPVSSVLWDDTCRFLADKVEEEVEQARRDAVISSAKPMGWIWDAIRNGEGWPEPLPDETFKDYMERCFYALPRYEDGSPVKFGEDGLREIRSRWCYTPLKEHVVETTLIYDDGERVVALRAERVRKPYSGTPGRDGLPIQEGETVWNWIRGTVATVTSLHPYGVHVDHDRVCEIWAYEHVVHTRPDMQEDIDEDAEMDPVEYCAVHDLDLGDDPDREKAARAMVSDILYRQRCVDMRQYRVE